MHAAERPEPDVSVMDDDYGFLLCRNNREEEKEGCLVVKETKRPDLAYLFHRLGGFSGWVRSLSIPSPLVL